LKSRNREKQSFARLQLSAATIVAVNITSSAREGRALVHASLPGYVGNRAGVILQMSYGQSTIWAVWLQRSGEAWRVVDSHQLGQG
jgi:hypothetical protein